MEGMAGWFAPSAAAPFGPLETQIRNELATRVVPPHVLTSILELLRGFPERSGELRHINKNNG
jgi:hypothetical protein